MRAAALAAVSAAVLTGSAHAATRDDTSLVPANPANYARADRPADAISLVVVHVVEGTSAGAISWFRNPRAHASANYVVSRQGTVTQMVPPWDIAWHAGNGWVNRHSVGIEHEGYAAIAGIFTDLEYRASARVVATLLRRSGLPPDRAHVIGHAEVPDPTHPGRFGGSSHHTDPGSYWDWPRYMSYVRSYAARRAPPAPAFDVAFTSPALLQRVTGVLTWRALPTGVAAQRVDFLVDGAPIATATTAPWSVSWDSFGVANGKHVLTAHAVSVDGRTATAAAVVVVQNTPIEISGSSLGGGDVVRGAVTWSVRVRGKPDRVEFVVDRVLRATRTAPPYSLTAWDTSQEMEGPHLLTVRAVRRDRTVASATFEVVVVH